MSLLLSFYRIIKFTIQNFFRNFWLSFVTITIFILTLITINAVIFMNMVAGAALQSVEEKVEVSVYFTPEASEELVKSAQGYLLGFDQVRDAVFVSGEDALELFTERHQDDSIILGALEEVGDNPFGHAIVIASHSPDDFAFILEAIETPEYAPFIKKKDYTDHEAVIENIESLNDRIRIGGIVLAIFFTIVAVMIIFNAIRVAIYVHRDEIGIMKLVGANDWFVRGPFLLEAILYSLFAVVVVGVAVFVILGFIDPWISSYFGEVQVDARVYFVQNGLLIFGAQFIILSFLSLLTTLFAMRRYLRV
jgi:cell division transport system permease protein